MTGLAGFLVPSTFLVCLEQAVGIALDKAAINFLVTAHADRSTHVLGWWLGFSFRGGGRGCLGCRLRGRWLLASCRCPRDDEQWNRNKSSHCSCSPRTSTVCEY